MTCIVSAKHYPTKKALRLWVQTDPAVVRIENPSLFTTTRFFSASDIKPEEQFTVTNHPKRSWFAIIGRKPTGELYVL